MKTFYANAFHSLKNFIKARLEILFGYLYLYTEIMWRKILLSFSNFEFENKIYKNILKTYCLKER